MLIYEVNLEVDEEVKVQFAGFLTEHIPKVLESPGFKAAQWFFRHAEDEDREPTGSMLWTIQYFVEDRASLDLYLRERAAAMRQEVLDRFSGKFSVTRRVLNLLSVAGAPFAGE